MTYNDGMVQHSSMTPVLADQFTDYLASLAVYIYAGNLDDGNWDTLCLEWPRCDISRNRVEFARNLKWSAPDGRAKQYYNLHDLRVSRSRSKAHDRRWEEVPEWADGSLDSIFRLLLSNSSSFVLNQYEARRVIVGHVEEITGSYWGSGYIKLKVIEGQKLAGQAFDAVNSMVQAKRAERHWKQACECLLRNLERSEQKQEQQ